jgi:hypothetical protein
MRGKQQNNKTTKQQEECGLVRPANNNVKVLGSGVMCALWGVPTVTTPILVVVSQSQKQRQFQQQRRRF